MGTYTTNYNLFMPSIGEQGWGDLINGNFTTIDNTMKGLSNRLSIIQVDENQNVTFPAKVSANGGFKIGGLTKENGVFSAIEFNIAKTLVYASVKRCFFLFAYFL